MNKYLHENWVYIVLVVCLTVMLLTSLKECDWDSANLSSTDRQAKWAHEEKMLLIQRDSMPKDSILLIKGVFYKLVKVK